MLQYANVQIVRNEAVFCLSNIINKSNEKESDCFSELKACLNPEDLTFFVESILVLDQESYLRLKNTLLRSFIRLIISYTTDLLVLLIKYHEKSERKGFALGDNVYFIAKKVSRYGYKKLFELETIAAFLDSIESGNQEMLLQVVQKLEFFFKSEVAFSTKQSSIFQDLLNAFLDYQSRIKSLYRWDMLVIKNWLEDQVKNGGKRLFIAILLSYSSLICFKHYFFDHISLFKKDFLVEQNPSILDFKPIVSTNDTTFDVSFDFSYFGKKKLEYERSYYPLSSLCADFFNACDVLCRVALDCFSQCKERLEVGSRKLSELQGLLEYYCAIAKFFVHGVGQLATIGVFVYCAYCYEKIIKRSAFVDFAMAFELFEKELYNKFSIDLYESEKIVYLELLLMHEGKKILSSERLCMLHYDIMHIKKFNSFNLIELYLKEMKQNYKLSM